MKSPRLAVSLTAPLDAAGRMSKDTLSKVFLMAKGPGWGAAGVPAALKNGDWIYTAYEGNGTRGAADQSSCRACHLPLAARISSSITMSISSNGPLPAPLR
jgi:hypothetical protein